MKLRKGLTLSSLLLLASLAVPLNAQQLETRPKSTGLVLEVVFAKGARPAFQTVAWTDNKKGSWYGRFDSVGRVTKDAKPVQAVRLVPFVEGQGVRVNVSVLRGEFLEIEQNVSTYLMDIGQKLSVEELKNVGVGPFELRLFRVDPSLANAPTFVNRTKSVEVVSFEPMTTTLPAYKVSIHNLSAKNISGLSVEVFSGGRLRNSAMPQGKEGKSLVEAGGFGYFETRVPVDAESVASGFNPAARPEHQIVIKAVMFQDGSYEGATEPAAMFQSFIVGRKLMLTKINPALASAVSAIGEENAPEKFVSAVKSLSVELQEDEVALLLRQFPAMNPLQLKDSVQASMHHTRTDLLEQAERFVGRADLEAGDYRQWLVDTKVRYADWLKRLE
jgi:hypothetical protein